MTTAISSRRDILIAVVCTIAIVVLTGGGAVLVISDPAFTSAAELSRAAEILYTRYAEPVDWVGAVDNGIDAIFEELDPYSGLVGHRLFDVMTEELSGGYGGLGISVYPLGHGLFIFGVVKDSPAQKSGLRLGDYILRADTVDFADTTRFHSTLFLRGEEGSTIALKTYRPSSGDTLSVIVTRGRVELQSVPFAGMTKDSILYVRIADFEAGVSDHVMHALEKHLPDEHAPVNGVILDLRDNPGGLLDEAIATADLFLENGALIVGTDGRSIWDSHEARAENWDMTFGRPIGILVNDQTASAAEILTGALKYNGRAFVMGDTTFGKGLVQGYVSLPEGDALRLTISRYYLEGKRYLNEFDTTLSENGRGLPPDTVITFADETPFLAQLDHQLLFHRFGSQYATQLDTVTLSEEAIDEWCDVFAGFCYHNGFSYASEKTLCVDVLEEAATVESASATTLAAVHRLSVLAKQSDSLLFSRHKHFIFQRITRAAVETLRGDEHGYSEIEVPFSETIAEAASILRSRQPKNGGAPLP